MSDDVQLVREIGEVKAELSGLKAEVAGTNQRLDDIVITQLKDHGKRIAGQDVRISALEAAENKRAGGLSVLAGVAAAAGSIGALIMKLIGPMWTAGNRKERAPTVRKGALLYTPRVWGRHFITSPRGFLSGNTPTYVGKTALYQPSESLRKKHPHVCGEDRLHYLER